MTAMKVTDDGVEAVRAGHQAVGGAGTRPSLPAHRRRLRPFRSCDRSRRRTTSSNSERNSSRVIMPFLAIKRSSAQILTLDPLELIVRLRAVVSVSPTRYARSEVHRRQGPRGPARHRLLLGADELRQRIARPPARAERSAVFAAGARMATLRRGAGRGAAAPFEVVRAHCRRASLRRGPRCRGRLRRGRRAAWVTALCECVIPGKGALETCGPTFAQPPETVGDIVSPAIG